MWWLAWLSCAFLLSVVLAYAFLWCDIALRQWQERRRFSRFVDEEIEKHKQELIEELARNDKEAKGP